jgi:hypothetical protein
VGLGSKWIIEKEEYETWFDVSRPSCTITSIKMGSAIGDSNLTAPVDDDRPFYMDPYGKIVFNALATEF